MTITRVDHPLKIVNVPSLKKNIRDINKLLKKETRSEKIALLIIIKEEEKELIKSL